MVGILITCAFFVGVFLSSATVAQREQDVEHRWLFSPPSLSIIRPNTRAVEFNVTSCSDFERVFSVASKDDRIATVTSTFLYNSDESIVYTTGNTGAPSGTTLGLCVDALAGNFSVLSGLIGRTSIDLIIESEDSGDKSGDPERTTTTYKVVVVRPHFKTMLDKVFMIVISLMFAIGTFFLSCELKWDVIVTILKKPIAPAIGMASQFIVMPLVAFGLSQAMPQSEFGLGLFTIGCCPGGGISNIWALLFDLDLDLSMTMTFLSSVGVFGTMPLWMYTLGRTYSTEADLSIPFINLFGSLCIVAVPSTIGLLLQKFKPAFAKKMHIFVKPISALILLTLFTLGVYTNSYMFEVMFAYWYILPIAVGLQWLAGFLGYALARILRQTHARAVTIAIETGVQNLGIAMILLKFSLGKPEGDLAATMIGAGGIFSPVPLYIIVTIFLIRKRFKTRREKKESNGVEGRAGDPEERKHFPVAKAEYIEDIETVI